MGTQIPESEPCICNCSWGSRTWIWYWMSQKPGRRAARRVRGPYLDYSTSTTRLLAAERADQWLAEQEASPDRWRSGDGGAARANDRTSNAS